jgi:hypothetical protein
MVAHYFVQIIITRSTSGPHVESRTLKLKVRVQTLEFQRFCLKFVENVLNDSLLFCANWYNYIHTYNIYGK